MPLQKRPARDRQARKSAAAAMVTHTSKIPARSAEVLRVETVMKVARQSGLIAEKTSRIGGRISADLVRKAKERTGIESDSELIEFALANIALEDQFPAVFKETKGAVDADLKLCY